MTYIAAIEELFTRSARTTSNRGGQWLRVVAAAMGLIVAALIGLTLLLWR